MTLASATINNNRVITQGQIIAAAREPIIIYPFPDGDKDFTVEFEYDFNLDSEMVITSTRSSSIAMVKIHLTKRWTLGNRTSAVGVEFAEDPGIKYLFNYTFETFGAMSSFDVLLNFNIVQKAAS